jgi:hypothetical protein
MKLGLFYAGPGTFWTDLRGFEQVLLGKLASDSISPGAPAQPADPPQPPAPRPASIRSGARP